MATRFLFIHHDEAAALGLTPFQNHGKTIDKALYRRSRISLWEALCSLPPRYEALDLIIFDAYDTPVDTLVHMFPHEVIVARLQNLMDNLHSRTRSWYENTEARARNGEFMHPVIARVKDTPFTHAQLATYRERLFYTYSTLLDIGDSVPHHDKAALPLYAATVAVCATRNVMWRNGKHERSADPQDTYQLAHECGNNFVLAHMSAACVAVYANTFIGGDVLQEEDRQSLRLGACLDAQAALEVLLRNLLSPVGEMSLFFDLDWYREYTPVLDPLGD